MSKRPLQGAAVQEDATRLAVVGTAGHIDHGKTAMVRRLTGIDTDRLPQERERGISIDLGFANLTTPQGRRVGIVDVPGHERFVRNMLAGVGGIDLVVLVVAADEGVMPQTREHFSIVSLLGIQRGVIVLTKSDLVKDPEWFSMVERDVADLVRGSFLETAPVVRFSATTGEGSDELLQTLDRLLAEDENRPSRDPARLPVDRCFVVEGFGTVVTGTLWQGRIRVGDTLSILPRNRSTRVRSVQVHGAQVEQALAGQRTAIALHGVSREQVTRGDWLVATGAMEPSRLITVRINLLKSLTKPLKDRTRIRFHLGAGELLGRAALLEARELAPGGTALAQIALESPTVAARGDRFVVRSYSPMWTIGGGVVIEPVAKRRKFGQIQGLEVTESGSELDRLLSAVVAAKLKPIDATALSKQLGLSRERVAELTEQARTEGGLQDLPDSRWVSRNAWAQAKGEILGALEGFASRYPIRWGRGKGDLKSALGRRLDAGLFDAVLQEMIAAGEILARDDHLRLAGVSDLDARQDEEMDRVIAAIENTGNSVPELSKLAATSGVTQTTEYVQRLLFEGRAVRVSQEFVYTRRQWQEILTTLKQHFVNNPDLRVADLKSLLGVSRKHAIPILEYADRMGFTVRAGDERKMGAKLRDHEPADEDGA